MTEGWIGNSYLVLFTQDESADLTRRYEITQHLPGYVLLGLCNWDDFICMAPDGRIVSVPTVPLTKAYVNAFAMPDVEAGLRPDPRFAGKIKWYVQPLVFGGSPTDQANLTWVDLTTHIQAVVWFNKMYVQMTAQKNP